MCTYFLLIAIITMFRNIECRVYCQDQHALSWVPNGYGCPITCTSIIAAITKLKQMDFKKMINDDFGQQVLEELQRDKDNSALGIDILRYKRKTNAIGEENGDVDMYEQMSKSNEISASENFIPQFEDLPFGCWSLHKFVESSRNIKLMRVPCTRRSIFDKALIKLMTNILNQYIQTVYKFTEEITEMLLVKFIGHNNTDLRHSTLDVDTMLKYLRMAISRHKKHTYKQSIELKSQHCTLTVIPGCFCRQGFVENFGQCVQPMDCITKTSDEKYFKRIILK